MTDHSRVWRLTAPKIFRAPGYWEILPRFAFQAGGRELQVQAGAWLLELRVPPTERSESGTGEHFYRLADGQVVVAEKPLDQTAAVEVDDPQAAIAMSAYRPLEQAIYDDLGLSLERLCRHLPPFTLIRCPLCEGADFVSLDLSSAWCSQCNAQFSVRHTAGDPGFVADCRWEHYSEGAARYLLPPCPTLTLTLVLKDSGDPRDMDTAACGCPQAKNGIKRTGHDMGLRPGLHACQVGTLYDWQLCGRPPEPHEVSDRHHGWKVDGQWWPKSATCRIPHVGEEERDLLWDAQVHLMEGHPGIAQGLKRLRERPERAGVFQTALPPVSAIAEGEAYILHHWLFLDYESSPGRRALPVWYVGRPIADGKYITGWQIVRRNICPDCGHQVHPDDMTVQPQGQDWWNVPHGSCRKTWEKAGWAPLFEPPNTTRPDRDSARE